MRNVYRYTPFHSSQQEGAIPQLFILEEFFVFEGAVIWSIHEASRWVLVLSGGHK